jgi:AbrB family looped-hinge helix DNA binding protein
MDDYQTFSSVYNTVSHIELGYRGLEKEPADCLKDTIESCICIMGRVTSKGQVTIPIEIRKKLGIKNVDKVLFMEDSGRIYMMNSSMDKLREAQRAFAGEAEKAGLKNDDDVMAMMNCIFTQLQLVYNKPKLENSRQPGCPEEKVKAIEEALKHSKMI